MTENCRKKMAISLVGTLPPPFLPKVGRANSLPFSLMAPGVMRSRRSVAFKTSLFSAARSPFTAAPLASVPLNVNTGIVPPLTYVSVLALGSRCCGRFRGLRPTVDHLSEFIRHGRANDGRLH